MAVEVLRGAVRLGAAALELVKQGVMVEEGEVELVRAYRVVEGPMVDLGDSLAAPTARAAMAAWVAVLMGAGEEQAAQAVAMAVAEDIAVHGRACVEAGWGEAVQVMVEGMGVAVGVMVGEGWVVVVLAVVTEVAGTGVVRAAAAMVVAMVAVVRAVAMVEAAKVVVRVEAAQVEAKGVVEMVAD